MDLLILCFGDLEEGLELEIEGDSLSSMDNLRGCSGDCVDTCTDSAGGVGVDDTAGVETDTKDTGVTNVDGLDKVGACVLTGASPGVLETGITRVCLISVLTTSSMTVSTEDTAVMDVEEVLVGLVRGLDVGCSSSSSGKSNTSLRFSGTLMVDSAAPCVGGLTFATISFSTTVAVFVSILGGDDGFISSTTSGLSSESVEDLRISAAIFSMDSSVNCLSSALICSA